MLAIFSLHVCDFNSTKGLKDFPWSLAGGMEGFKNTYSQRRAGISAF